jgi:hypothetical protein
MAATTPNEIPPDLSRSDSSTSLGKRKRDAGEDGKSPTFIKSENTDSEPSQNGLDGILKDALESVKRSVAS